MGATPNYALPYPELDEPDDVPTDLHDLATAVEGGLDLMVPLTQKGVAAGVATLDATGKVPIAQLPPILASTRSMAPPAAPTDGQEWVCVDSLAAPTFQWLFRYNAAAAGSYPWEFVGGTRYRINPGGGGAGGANGVWVDLGAIFTFPRAGEYEVEWYGSMNGQASASSSLYGLGFSTAALLAGTIMWNLTAALAGAEGLLVAAAAQALHAYWQDSDATRRNSLSAIRVFITPKHVA